MQLAGIYLLALRVCCNCLHGKFDVWVDGSKVFDAFLELVPAYPRLFLHGRSVSCLPYQVTADCCYFLWAQASCKIARHSRSHADQTCLPDHVSLSVLFSNNLIHQI